MGFFTAIKTPSTILLLVFSYVVFILCILCIQGNEVIFSNYPPGVCALMAGAIFQMLWLTAQVIWGKHKIFSILNILIATAIFWAWVLGASIAISVLKHHHQYCPPGNELSGDCAGRLRGTFGMGYALMGWDLFYIGILIGVVVENSASYTAPIGLVPDRRRPVDNATKA